MGGWETFGFGGLGVLLLNCVQYLEISRIPQVERPIDFGQKPYWLDFFARPVIGGVLAWVYWYIGEPIGPLVAMNIGVSAPLILKAMAKTAAVDVSTNND